MEYAEGYLQSNYPQVLYDVNVRNQIVVYESVYIYKGLIINFEDNTNIQGLIDRNYIVATITTKEECDKAVNDYFEKTNGFITFNDKNVNEVIRDTSKVFNVPSLAVKGKGRTYRALNARHLAAYIMRHKFSYSGAPVSLEMIGWSLNRNHATIINSLRRVEEWIGYNKEYRMKTKTILSKYGIKIEI